MIYLNFFTFEISAFHHSCALTPYFTDPFHSQASWNYCPNVLSRILHLVFIFQPVHSCFYPRPSTESTRNWVTEWLPSCQVHCTHFGTFSKENWFSYMACSVVPWCHILLYVQVLLCTHLQNLLFWLLFYVTSRCWASSKPGSSILCFSHCITVSHIISFIQ